MNTQHLTSFSKINSNKEHFRTLNHHQKMSLALIKTNQQEPNHQVYNSSQQQQEYRETETARIVDTRSGK
jgi:hypothetical protein